MKQILICIMIVITFLMFSTSACPGNAWGARDEKAQQNKGDALMSRIDFGNSYILGQTIKSGAVYLMQRKKSEISSMLKYRRDYRKEILEDFTTIEMKRSGPVKEGK
ncbi:MAG: hypothetical protein JXM72_04315 [Deltaproteobacteria bacterium]|nr:hypothetical protein [Deltaproteobacteria bacterium]